MPNTLWSASGVDDALDGITANWISLHDGSPGTTGAGEITGGSYARVQTTWAAAAGNVRGGSNVTLNVPGGTTVDHFGVWDAQTGGTYKAGSTLSVPETFGGAGTYTLAPSLSGTG